MGAAQKISYDIDKEIIINMPQDGVWEILNQPDLLKKASNGYVTSVTVTDANFPVEREVVFSDNSKRKESIKQLDKQYKFMVIQLGTESLPKGVNEAEIMIFTKDKDKQCQINWKALVKGNSEGKKALIEKLTAEFNSYAAGFEKLTKNVIPAASLN